MHFWSIQLHTRLYHSVDLLVFRTVRESGVPIWRVFEVRTMGRTNWLKCTFENVDLHHSQVFRDHYLPTYVGKTGLHWRFWPTFSSGVFAADKNCFQGKYNAKHLGVAVSKTEKFLFFKPLCPKVAINLSWFVGQKC